MNASDKLNQKIAALTVDQLKEISLRMTLATTAEEIIVCNRVERELTNRCTDAELAEHFAACEALLDLAA